MMQESKRSEWTKEQNKWFESALAIFDTETPDRWSNVAAFVPGKSEHEVREQYEELQADINNIEAGFDEVPGYLTVKAELNQDHRFGSFKNRFFRLRSFDHERRKGVPWTEEEHRRFLMGLEVHGKGDWRNISRNFVVTKTPTQVASHAQKYYARQHSDGKEKRRPSIHDITTVHLARSTSFPNDTDKFSSLVNTPNNGIDIRVYNSGLFSQPTRYQVQG
ncbi:putative transcription factor MYB family [Helianthus annuus]|nr:putative transcription factor MYB family [Helianthus annuus]